MAIPVGKVALLQGQAFARARDGRQRALKIGDAVMEGDVIVTAQGGHVEIAFFAGKTFLIGEKETVKLDASVWGNDHPAAQDAALLGKTADTAAVADAIAKGKSLDNLLEETAAGVTGGGASDGHDFVRLLRIVEDVAPLAYTYDSGDAYVADTLGDGGIAMTNTPPEALDDQTVTDEDTPVIVDVRANDSDAQNDVLTVISVSNGAHGTVKIDPVTGNPEYTPSPNWNGTDTFTYTISDGHGGTATATVTVVVNPVNDAPVPGTIADPDGNPISDPNSTGTGDYSHTIPEDTPVSGQVSATDVDGDVLTCSLATGPAHGVVTVAADGSYTYTPNANYNGNDVFTVLVDDGHGGTAISTVTIIITPVADPSVITAGQGSVTEDVVLTTSGKLSISDPDGPQDEHFVAQSNVSGAHGTFAIDENGNWTYSLNNSDPAVQALNPGQTLTEVFPVTGVDGTPTTVTVVINGTAENRPPNAGNDSVSTNQDVPVPVSVLNNDTDPDGNTLTISGFGQGANGAVTQVGNQLVYTPNAGFVGTDTFVYSISDGQGGTDTATVTVVVGAVGNQAPNAVDDGPLSTDVNVPLTAIDVLGNDADPDGDTLTVTAATSPNGTVSINANGTLDFTPTPGFTGPTTIVYTIDDGHGGTDTATVTINVNAPGNQAPNAVDDGPLSTDVNVPLTAIDVLGNDADPDGDTLTVTAATSPNGTVSINANGTLDFTPTPGFTGPTTIVYTIDDGHGGTDTATVTINVNAPANQAPNAVDDGPLSTDVNVPLTAIDVLGNDADPDGDTLTVTAATSPNGTVSINANGTLDFTPTPGFTGPTTIVYTIDDGHGGTDTATVTINVLMPDDPTVTIPDTNGAAPGEMTLPETAGPTAGSFTISAPAGLDHITIGGTTFTPGQLADPAYRAAHPIDTGEGTLIVTGYNPTTGVVSYTYDPKVQNFNGDVADSIPVVVTDVLGHDSPANAIDITITDSKPVAVNDTNSISEDAVPNTVTGSVLTGTGADTVGADINATPVTPVSNLALAHGSLTLGANGEYTYTLNNADPAVNALNDGQTLTDSYVYTLTDGDGSSTTATLTITINGHTDGTPTVTIPDTNGAAPGEMTLPETAGPTVGSFTISAPAGLDHITIGGTAFTPEQLADPTYLTNHPIDTGEGTLVVTGYNPTTGVVSYTYDPKVQNFNGDVADSIPVVVTDVLGHDSPANAIDLTITDSKPVAVNDTNSISEDAVPNTVTGSVLTGTGADTVGADINATPVTPVSNLALAHGSLTLGANGEYTYTLNNADPAVNALNDGQTLTDSYVYTLTDGDGSSTTATLTITINGHTDGTPTVTIPDTNGAAPGEMTLPETAGPTAGSFTISAPAGLDHITIGGTTFTPGQLADPAYRAAHPIDTGEGTLVVTGYNPTTGVVSYTYDPKVQNFNGDVADSIPVVVTDVLGHDSPANAIDLTITDSKPVAVNDTNSISEDAVPNTVTGSVLTGTGADTVGADINATPVTPVSNLALAHGSLTLGANGEYTYTLNNADPAVNALNDGQTLTDSYVYTLTDGDGSSTTATLTITINGHTDGTPTVTIPDTNGAAPGEMTLPETAGPTAGSFTISAPAGLDHITIGGTAFTPEQLADPAYLTNHPIDTGEGTLVVTGYNPTTGVVSYTYDPKVQNFNGDVADSIPVVVTDVLGHDSPANAIDLTITDSKPVAVNDTNSISEDAVPNTVTGSVLTGTGADTVGADVNATPVTPVSNLALAHGSLTLGANGEYTYTLNNADPAVNALNDGQTLTDSYVYTLTDGDGSSTTATLVITINGHTDGTPTVTIPDTNGAAPGEMTLPETAGPTAGSFTISAPAGLDHITIGGTAFTPEQLADPAYLTNHPIDTGEGTLVVTGYNPTTGVVSYTYDPKVQNFNGDVADSIPVVVTDVLGHDSPANAIDLTITDSKPVAVNDTNSISEDAVPNTVTGSVLTGTGADTVGADVNATPVTPVSNLALAHGSLTLGANGEYTYTLNNADPAVNALNDGQTLTDSYVYTLTDGDGSSTTATLVITINGHTDGTPTVTIPDTNGAAPGEMTLPETAGPTAGSFAISAPAGLDHITIGGTAFTPEQLADPAYLTNHPIDTGEGTLVVTGYNPTTGVVSYTYDPKVQNFNGDVADSIPVVVTDVLGHDSPANAIDITITDSKPVAVNDANSISEDAVPNSVTGNVLTGTAGVGADTVGADINATPVTPVSNLALAHGSLTLGANGEYTYTLNNADPAVNALNDGQTLTDSYVYTLTDGDGSSTTATLTITINGHTDGTPTVTIPDTNGAAPGEMTLPETAGPTAGSFTISAPAGLDHITIGGTTFTPGQLADPAYRAAHPIDTGEGTLIVTGYNPTTGVVSYTYDPKVQNFNGDVADSIPVVVTDVLGHDSPANAIDITITDSKPVAVNDTNSISEDAVPNTVTGSVLTGTGADTVGADINATPVTPVSNLALAHGSLTLGANGEYTYTLNNADPAVNALNDGQTLTDSYVYTLTDGDGSSTTATLTITINGHTDGTPTVTIPDTNGAAPGEMTLPETAGPTAGSFTISAPAGLDHITIGGTTFTPGQLADPAYRAAHPIDTGEGTLIVTGYNPTTGVVSYTYDPKVQNFNGDVADSIPVVVTDVLGHDSPANAIDITITDSKPVAVNDTNSISEDAVPNTVTGSVLTGTGADTVGADINATPVTPVSNLALAHGSLTLGANGEYTYTLNNADPAVNALNDGQTLTDSYVYTLTDGDGSSTTATLTITINGHTDGTPTVTIPDTNGAAPGEMTLPETAGPTAGSFTISAPAGLDHITIGGTTFTPGQLADPAYRAAHPIDTGEGTLIVTGYNPTTGVVSYTYDPKVQNFNGDVADSIPVVVTDVLGHDSPANAIDITITDSKPVAVNDTNSISEDAVPNTVTGSVLTGTGADTVGADINATPVTPVSNLALAHGSLTLGANGEYTYTLNNADPAVNALNDGQTLTDSYVYTLTDGDGSSTTATLTITINGHTDGTPTVTIPDTNGAAPGEMTLPETAGPTAGSFTISAPAGLDHITIGGTTFTPGQLADPAYRAAHPIDTGEGTLVVTGYNPTTGVVSYTYDPKVQNFNGDVADSIPVVVTDVLGHDSPANAIDLTITDSKPVAVNDTNSISEDAVPNTVTGSVLTGTGADTVGADINATPVTPVSNLALAHGSLTLGANGEYTYTLNNADPAVNALNDGQTLTDSYVYTLTDGDGSSTTATLTITINGHNDAPVAKPVQAVGSEDTPLIINWTNFGYSDVEGDAAASARIVSLPADGRLQYFNGSVWTNVTSGQIVSKAMIDSGQLRFVPDTNESGGDAYAASGVGDQHKDYAAFQYQLIDTHNVSSAVATLAIDVTAVADTPTISMSGSATVTQLIVTSNVSSTGNGFTVSALSPTGAAATISTHAGPAGFGVNGIASGDDTEIGYRNNVGSEWLIVNLDNAVISADVSFAWKHSNGGGETALIRFYNNGVLVGSNTYNGGSDSVDPAITVQPSGGGAFDEIRFGALGSGDDYLINSISFDRVSSSSTTVTTDNGSTVDLSVSSLLTDLDGSEVLRTTIDGIATGYSLTDGVHTFTGTATAHSVDVSGWNLADMQLVVPDGVSGTLTLTATATATETSTGVTATATANLVVNVAADGGITAMAMPQSLASQSVAADTSDVVLGTSGDDTLAGGPGSDTLTGGVGSDTFVWSLGDQGTVAVPARDEITDFDAVAKAAGGDVLDLRDLLVGEAHSGANAGNLANYLHFSYDATTDTTTVNVSSHAAGVDQTITLAGVNLVGGLSTDQAIIQDLLTRGKLVTD